MQPTFYNDLDASLNHAWQQLERACVDREHGFHTMQIATIATVATADDAGAWPQVRTVVLRDVDADAAVLRFHTDRRSPKVAELTKLPHIAVHAYDGPRKLQLRLRGHVTMHSDDALADQAWRSSRPSSRLCYRVPMAPGTEIAAPDEADYVAAKADGDPGREHFAAVCVHVRHIDWLYLAAGGHRRAQWRRRGAGWRGEWLVP